MSGPTKDMKNEVSLDQRIHEYFGPEESLFTRSNTPESKRVVINTTISPGLHRDLAWLCRRLRVPRSRLLDRVLAAGLREVRERVLGLYTEEEAPQPQTDSQTETGEKDDNGS